MNNLNKSRELLKKYFRETPKEVLNEKFEKFNQIQFEGQSITDYLSMFSNQYAAFDNNNTHDEIIISNNDTTWTQLDFSDEKNDKVISNAASILIKTDISVEFENNNYYFAMAA